MESKKEFLTNASRNEPHFQIRNTRVRFNPPLLIIRDRGNAYVLRRKVPGIHWEEALEQLQTTPALKDLNNHLGLERIISRAVAKVMEKLRSSLNGVDENVVDPSGIFVSWDLKINQPRVLVDISNSHLETLWVS